MTKYEFAERRAEVSGARAFFRKALEKYEAALAAVERAKAELELRETEYRKVESFAFA